MTSNSFCLCSTDFPEITEDGPDYARGGGGLESSDEEEEEEEDGEEEEVGILDHHWNEPDHDAPEAVDITHRLALCNMDWDRIKARDLYVLFNSFVPQGGALQSVTIYPSQTGLEKMAEEEKLGPREFREGKEAEADDKSMEELNRARLRQYQLNRLKYYFAVIVCDSKETANKIYEDCDSTEYEKSTCRIDLRFIPDDMTFDETPKETCTGVSDLTSFQPSSFTTTAFCQASVQVTWDETDIDRLNKTMKKFTEEDVENDQFDELIASSEEESSDEAAENGDEKTAGKETKKKNREKKKMKKYRKLLGLEADKKSKKKKKTKKKKAKPPLAEEDGEEEEEDEEMQLTLDHSVNGKKKKKKATKNVKTKAPKDFSSDSDEGEGEKEGEMQFTWTPSIDQQTRKKKGKEKLTPWEEYQRKKKEKKREKRRERKQEKLRQQGIEDTTDLGFDDPFFNDDSGEDAKKKKGKKERRKKKGEAADDKEDDEEDRKEKASLGLLMNDDNNDRRSHFSLLKIMKEEEEERKKKKRKGKKRKQPEPADADAFEVSLDEARFAGLYTDPEMHIDPNAPEFKKTKGMVALMEEVSKKRKTARDAR